MNEFPTVFEDAVQIIAAALRTYAGESAAQSERAGFEKAERIVRSCLIEAPTHAEDKVIERACAAIRKALDER